MHVHWVWYVAYGSNMAWPRFRCYVAGGQPDGGNRVYLGCRDRSDPLRMESLDVPGGLVFGGWSSVWGGGMAFYDARGGGRAACRAYLVTADQFADVAAQEMRRPPGGEFAHDLAGLLPDVESVHTMGSGRYETVARLGMLNGIPLFTVTHAKVSQLQLAAPTSPYLRWIAAGLRESHGWSTDRIGEYLARSRGVVGSWTSEEIARLVDE